MNDGYWYFFLIDNKSILTIPCFTKDSIKELYDSRNMSYDRTIPAFHEDNCWYVLDAFPSIENFKKYREFYIQKYPNHVFVPYKMKQNCKDITSRIRIEEGELYHEEKQAKLDH